MKQELVPQYIHPELKKIVVMSPKEAANALLSLVATSDDETVIGVSREHKGLGEVTGYIADRVGRDEYPDGFRAEVAIALRERDL